MKFINDTAYTICFKVFRLLIGIISSIVLARILGPVGKGEFVQVLLPVSLFYRLISIGLPVSQIYCVNKFSLNRENAFNNAVSIICLICIFTLPIYYYGIDYIHSVFFNNLDFNMLLLMCVALPLELLVFTFSYSLMIDRNIISFNLVELIRVSLFLLIIPCCAYYFNINLTVIIWIHILTLFLTLLATIYLLKRINLTFKFKLEYPVVKKLITYGSKTHIGQIFILINERLDIWLISYYLTTKELGVYSIALLATKFVTIPESIGVNIFPVITKNTMAQGKILIGKVLRVSISFSLIIMFVGSILSEKIINILYGEIFSNATLPFILLLPLILTHCIAKSCRAYLAGNGYPLIASYASGVSLLYSFIIGVYLVKNYGIIGAAITTTSSSIIYASILLIFYIVKSNDKLSNLVKPKSEDIIALSAGIIKLWRKFIS